MKRPTARLVRADPGPQREEDGRGHLVLCPAQALDIPLHVHTGIRTTHYKHLWLAEEDFWTVLPAAGNREVDVIIPVLHRPQNIKPLMQSLRASTGLATACFVCEHQARGDRGGSAVGRCALTLPDGHTFAEKVNFAYGESRSPWVLLVGDDVMFRPGWLDHAQDVARRYRSEVVGTNDLANPRVIRGEHATHR